MPYGPENRRGLSEEEMNFTAPAENTAADIRDINQEKKFELEITKEVIAAIREQMDRERKIGMEKLMRKLEKEGRTPEEKELKEAEIKGYQSFTFEAAALARLAKEFPELNIGKVEMSPDDINISKKRLERDIAKAVVDKKKDGEKKRIDRGTD